VYKVPKDPLALQRLVEGFDQLVNNEFWHEFWKYIEHERLANLEDLGKDSYEDRRLRYLQGINEAFKKFQQFPERLLNEINRELGERSPKNKTG
jgi:hypothetical protein